MLVPNGTPPNVIAKLNAAFNKTMADPEVRRQPVGQDVRFGAREVLLDV